MKIGAQWAGEIEAMRAVLEALPLDEETKWGKPCFLHGGKNVVLMQGFKTYFSLLFFGGALLADPKKRLEQLGKMNAARVMKFTSAKQIESEKATIRAYVREAIALAESGQKVPKKKTADVPVPVELTAMLKKDARLKKAFEALTPGRQRSYLYHFGDAKQSATRTARIEKAMPAIFEGRGFLERPKRP
jgi:uncharacterized protein YdeI (YjbR/CyaY-like superfamily)